MFYGDESRVFALPCGADFPALLVAGLRDRLKKAPPEAMARVELFVNSDRMARAVRAAFDTGPAGFLPRIRLVTDLADPLDKAALPKPVPALRRRLELAGLVSKLIEQDQSFAARAAAFDLADSLAGLMDEMQAEGVSPEAVAALDVSDESGHWARALSFIRIVQPYFDAEAEPDGGALSRMALEQRLARWQARPPQYPVIVAGSTGSRGTTHRLMLAVARLPQGGLVLPGFDFHMPGAVWDRLSDALTGEDHPQFRYAKLLQDLDFSSGSVRLWHEAEAPEARNKALSLALRPAPVTHQWRSEGPSLPDLPAAMQDVTLLEAPTPRDEAQAIALRLRAAAEDGTRAALITPDRMLTRQVTSALDRWGIVPDDSAGIPAQLTPPGRLLRHVAGLLAAPLSAEALLAILKHPLTHSGADRGPHVLNAAKLELTIRRKGWAYPTADLLRGWGESHEAADWAAWVVAQFCEKHVAGQQPLATWVDTHLSLTEAIAAGQPEGSGGLWEEAAGRTLLRIVENLRAEAAYGAEMTARDYVDLFGAVLAREEQRRPDDGHPDILIWGTLEARVMGADLIILAGLNEGSWPEMPAADPWLNRRMRMEAGLLLPERRIGLSAHDFQQAAGGREIWFSRALKSDDAETVPSRWLNRLQNLMGGLPDRRGPEALVDMRARGREWLTLARLAETPIKAAPQPRPSPAPPVAARPKELPVTAIKRLIRDPYAIYARYVLGLRELNPLMRSADALERGILTHSILERFVKETRDAPDKLTAEHLLSIGQQTFGNPQILPFPTARILWQSRLARVAGWFTAAEQARQSRARPAHFEIKGGRALPALGFNLTATADRIDVDTRGSAYLYDYKTGAAPSAKAQRFFDKQLLLAAAIAEAQGFPGLQARHVAEATFISLAPSAPKDVPAPLQEAPPGQVWEEFTTLITAYMSDTQGYTARRAMLSDKDVGDYDQLARFGEWDLTDPAQVEPLI